MLRKIKREQLKCEFKEQEEALIKKNGKAYGFSNFFHEKYDYMPNISKLELKLKARRQKKKRKLRKKNKQRKEAS